MNEVNPQGQKPPEGQEAQHHKSLTSVLDCVIFMDASGRVVMANDRAANLAQLDPEELKQLELPQITGLFENHVHDSEAFQKQLAAIRQTTPLTAELVFPLAGALGSLRVYLMPVVQVQSPPELEATKRAERTEEEELEHLKREFLSTISHELRTPLTAIKGSLGLALGGAAGSLAPELRELLELAGKNTDRLISLTNSILDMFKLETHRLPLRVEPISVAESIQHELNSHSASAEKKDVTVEAQIEPDLSWGGRAASFASAALRSAAYTKRRRSSPVGHRAAEYRGEEKVKLRPARIVSCSGGPAKRPQEGGGLKELPSVAASAPYVKRERVTNETYWNGWPSSHPGT